MAPECRAAVLRDVAADHKATRVNWVMSGVTDAELRSLALALEGNTHVREINLQNNPQISDDGARPLRDVVRRCGRVVALHLWATSVSTALKTQIAELCKANVVALVASNDPATTMVNWQCAAVGDKDLRSLAAAMLYGWQVHAEPNAHLQEIRLTYNDDCCDVGADVLRQALWRSGVVTIVCKHTGFTSGMIGRLTRICVANACVRMAANDPAIVQLKWWDMPVDDSAMVQLAESLRGNTHLRHLSLGDNTKIGVTAALALRRAAGTCALEKVDLPSSTFRTSFLGSDQHKAAIAVACAQNRADREAGSVGLNASLAWHRPYQRLLLAALFSWHENLSLDLMELVAGCLCTTFARVCPRLGSTGRPSVARDCFEWHR